MKHLSVKQKLTLWITLLMLLLSTLVLGFMVAVSSSVVTENAYDQLTSAVQNNLSGISRENGSLKFSEGFSFTNNGVYTVIYSDSGALLAGQLPLAFPEGTALETVPSDRCRGWTTAIMRLTCGFRSDGRMASGCAVSCPRPILLMYWTTWSASRCCSCR